MKKTLSLFLAAGLILCGSLALADATIPSNPCVKPEARNVKSPEMGNYESCMAAFIASQKSSIANHEAALRKAEAAMEDMSNNSSK